MRHSMAVLLAVAVAACGGEATGPGPVGSSGSELTWHQEADGIRGTFVRGADEVAFSSREVEEGIFDIEVRLLGLTLTGLLDPANGVSALDGFVTETGEETQLLDGDRELLSALYAALNEELPAGAGAGEAARYLRRAVGHWAQQPSTVELPRTVMGEEGRGYTMLCSYVYCGGKQTGTCSSYNWYYYAKHDCNKGDTSYTGNQQIAQLGDHGTCSGDTFYLSGSTWLCGEPDHWSRPKMMGNCFGRCGGGCGGDTQYTLDATDHDGCVRSGHALASMYCNDEFLAAADDELFAPDCY